MSDTQGTLDLMKEAGVKVTRESFIEVAYLGTPPDPWTALDEGELPDELQDFSLFTVKGAELIYNGPNWVVEAMEKHLPPKWLGHNQPPVQEQLDDLREQVKSMREALSCVMAAMLPAFQALEHLEDAARHMAKYDEVDGLG